MNKEYVNASEVAKKYNLYLKIVTSVKSYDTYNSFFNIFDQQDEACRRIAILTKEKDLEEVYDENPTINIENNKIVDGSIWIKSFSLLTNPEKIDLSKLEVSKELVEKITKID